MRAVCRGLRCAERQINAHPDIHSGKLPAFRSGVIVCAMRFFNRFLSEHYASYIRALPLTSWNQTLVAGILLLPVILFSVADPPIDGV
jgi:lipid-A-disaccharide synthase-like uncharacterized protein